MSAPHTLRTSAAAIALATGALVLAGCPSTPAGYVCPRACAPGLEQCCPSPAGGNACVLLSDSANCGSCGHNCFGLPCFDGFCDVTGDAGPPPTDAGVCAGGFGTRTCPDGVVSCSGLAGDPNTDGTTHISFTNCNGCDIACDPRLHSRCGVPGGAVTGTPRCLCGAFECTGAMDQCAFVGSAYQCLHLASDTANCGAVGNACGSGESCVSGTCVCDLAAGTACAAGETCCAGACVDVTTDAANCGACGMACQSGETCTTDAVSGASSCGCGTGPRCDAALTCVADACVCNPTTMEVCGAGQTCCAQTCVDTTTDSLHCGACGVSCLAGEQCVTTAGVSECLCGGTTACAPFENATDGATGELCCDDGTGTGTFACIPQDWQNCGGCGVLCAAATDACVVRRIMGDSSLTFRTCCDSETTLFTMRCPAP